MKLNIQYLLLIAILVIAMLPGASAEGLLTPTLKSYDPGTNTISFKDSILGIPTSDIGSATLDTPQINYVMPGKDRLVAKFTIDLSYDNWKGFIDGIEFKNNYNGQSINRNIIYKYATYENYEYDVIDYKNECGINENNTYSCSDIPIGSHKEIGQRIVWHDFDSLDLQKGIIDIGFFTDVLPGDNVEFVPIFFGVRCPEYATWQSSMNIGLVDYWPMDNNTNVINISRYLSPYTGTTQIVYNATCGFHGFGGCFDASHAMFIANGSISNYWDFQYGNFTVSFWLKPRANNNDLFIRREAGVFGSGIAIQGDKINTYGNLGGGTIGYNNWIHVAVVANVTGTCFYYNGTYINCGAAAANNKPLQDLVFGHHNYDDLEAFMDEVGYWNRSLSASEVSDLYNGGSGIFWTNEFGGAISLSLNSPLNGYNSSSQSVTFNCTGNSTLGVLNVTLIIDDKDNYTITNTTGFQNLSLQISRTLNDNSHNWTCRDSDGSGLNGDPITGVTRNLTVDSTNPTIAIIFPTATNYNTNISTLNYTYSDVHNDSCWYSRDGGGTNSSKAVAGTNFTLITSVEGSNYWILYCNDTFNNQNSIAVNFFKDTVFPLIDYGTNMDIDGAFKNQNNVFINTTWTELNFQNITFRLNATVYNTTSQIYSYNFTGLADGYYTYNVTICDIVNNCNTTASRNITLDRINPSISIVSPTAGQNFNAPPDTFDLNFTAVDPNLQACWYSYNGGVNTSLPSCNNASIAFNNLSSNNIILYANDSIGNWNSTSASFNFYPTLTICNDTIRQRFLNITFYDEISLAKINASIDSSSWSYYDSNGSSASAKIYSFTNLTNGMEDNFCMSPNWTRAYNNATIKYSRNAEAVNYPQRTKSYDALLTNATANLSLYLLSTADGQYVTFQVITSSLQPISGVLVSADKSGVIMESKLTDASGGATLWLDPNTAYTITASKANYITYSASITPAQTSYTITLQQLGESNVTDFNVGLNYSIMPVENSLNSNMTYSFNFTISSAYYSFVSFWFNLTNATGGNMASVLSTNAAGGTINSNKNVTNNQTIIMDAYWNINGTVFHTSKQWFIGTSADTQYSILNFITDLKSYTSSGMFGLDNFGLAIIIFILIFISTGAISFNFGLTSPAAVSGIITGWILLFDAGLGMMVFPFGARFVASIVFSLITIALMIKEGTSY